MIFLNNLKKIYLNIHPFLNELNNLDFEQKAMIEEFGRELEQARVTEKKNKELAPYYPPKKSHFDVMIFNKKTEYNNNIINQVQVKKTYTTNFKHSALTNDLSSLKPIYINQLMINKKNLGTYFICRSITDCFQISAVMAMVEDEKGNIEDLSIYNYYHKNFNHLQYFPKGTVFYIKEPFLKLPISGQGSLIRVDSPSDIIVDDYNLSGKFKSQIIHLTNLKNPTHPDWEDLKNLGNDHYCKKKYELAIRCYKIGICIKEKAVLYSNLAASYLGLDYYFQGYRAGVRGLELLAEEGKDSVAKLEEKLNFRIGKAFYCMRQWEKASEYFRKCFELNKENKENQIEIKRCEQRLREQKSCNYNFLNMFLNENKYDLDVADYTHANLTIAQNEEKGHHIITNSFIPKNTILVVSKAFSYYKDLDKKGFVLSFNVQENKMDEASQYHAKSKLFHNVHSNPFLAKEVYGLFSKNRFNRKEIIPDEIVDVLILETIADVNFFGGQEMDKFYFMTPEENKKRKESEQTCGLWVYPSLFNHSCVSNCERHFFGDVMTIISRRDLGKGEELTLNYVPFMEDYEKRKNTIELHYGFKCKCELCETDRRDTNLKARKRIFDEEFPRLKDKLGNPKKLKEISNKLIKTYENRSNFQFDLILFHATLAQCYFLKMKFKKAGDLFMSITEIVHGIDCHLFCLFCLKAAKTYRCGNLMDLADRATKLAMENDVFKDPILFKIRFKELFE